MEKPQLMSFGSAKHLLHEEGAAVTAAAPSKQFLMNLIVNITNFQIKTRIDTLWSNLSRCTLI